MAAATFSQTFFAPGGGVAASCKAYTYVRGTTTPLAAYTDVGLTTPATNPVIGSGVGVLLFYLDGVEDYSLTIKTSDDATTLMQVDYVAAGGFFSIISYTIENVQFAEFPFTGDGAETEYTLSNVLAPSVHSLWIALDGVYQPVSTYSVTRDSTDTHVTFGTAPANNADITIRLMALQGQRGDDGDSAYEVAVNNGFVGTEPEWLETLIGTSSRDEQVFSGDASDTTFVFTGMVITDKLNIMIFVDGIVQREADYSLSNNGTDTTITFDTAPPLGTNNIVMRGAVLTGGGGVYTDEMARDAIATALTAGTGVTITPNDGADTITVASSITQYTDEMARDALGTALTAGTGVTITPNDGSDIITVAIDTTAEAERIRDVIGTALVAGSNITLTVNDGSDTITIAATGGGGSYTDEEAQDAAAALFTPDDGDIDFTYNDATPSITAQIKALAVGTAELADDAVTFAKLLNATAAGFIGATGAGAFSERTPAQVTAALDAVVGDSGSGGTKGLVPAPGAGDTAAGKFLKANGLWDIPSGSGSGDVVGPASVTDSNLAAFDGTTGKLIKQVTNATAFANIKQAASDTATGVVELATDAETETGTDTARAVTPANVTASYIKKSLVPTRGDIITRGASAPQRLALGASGRVLKSDGTDVVWAGQSEIIIIAVGDETTALTTGMAKVTFRMPFAMTLTSVRGSLTTVSSSGIPTINIKESGSTIFSTKLTIDASEKTSTTAATAAVLSDTALADDAEITIDIDVAGTGAAGLKVALIGTRA